MRALEPEVFDAVFGQVEPLLPDPADDHPLGCHRPRVPDRICLWAMLVRLVTGCSWVVAERLLGGRRVGHDPAGPARRVDRGRSLRPARSRSMLAPMRPRSGLDPADAMVDGSIHKAPAGGEGTGKSPVDRGKSRLEVVDRHRRARHPHRLGGRRGQPNDSVLLPGHPRGRRRPGPARRRSRRCTSTAATTTASSATSWPARHPRMVVPQVRREDEAKRRRAGRSHSAAAGSSSAPTRGCRTTASSGATPTARSSTEAPSWPSRSRFCSSPGCSTRAT